jgi:DNA (cytosine-5)-methyltransferase 1
MGLNILSLFDGMSCGQQALERAGIEVDNYFASEIDKYAMQVTMANYPDTKQLGSVVNVNGSDLPKIDLLIGGSPCQSFSFAGKRKGMATKCETEILTLNHYLELKADGYEFEGQSYLFWEFMRLLNECKPKYFLLENVEMGEKWEKVLSKAIGVNGIHINSALVSAQNRKRIYWTNIGMQPGGLFGDLVSIIQKPKDKGILLKDVLETEVDEKYFLSDNTINRILKSDFGKEFRNPLTDKSTPLLMNYYKQGNDGNYIKIDKKGNIKTNQDKASCFSAGGHSGGNHSDMDLIVHNTMPRSSTTGKGGTGHLSRNDGKTYCLDTGNTNAVEIVGLTEVRTQEAKQIRKETGTNPKRAKELILRTDGKIGAILTSQTPDNLVISGTLRTHNDGKGFRKVMSGKGATIPARSREDGSGQNIVSISGNIRRLTPLECERLQTVKDNYTNHVSDSQRYKMLGNGWTVDVIAHIFSYLK